MNSARVKDMAHETCYGATGKVRAQFIALAKANGYEGAAGGWIYRAGSAEPIAQGWTALAGRVLCDAITLDASTLAPLAKPTKPQARFLTALADGHAAPQNVVGSWSPINACTSNGWAVAVPLDGGRVAWQITAEGRAVIGRPIEAETPTVIDGFQVPDNAADTRDWYSYAADRAAMYAEDDDSREARNARLELRAARQAKERLA